ncbi:MAG: transketolase family protein [Clostridia bacterium]|nr:transketolase family protein [Clostridia bacterium]
MYDKISMRDAFGQALVELAREDDNIFYLAADTTKSMGGALISKEFPDRARNVGIAEQNMMLMASGMASCGAKVFAATYAVFASMRVLEQVRTFIAYPKLDVKLIAGLGGITGGIEGATHQGTEDIGIMRNIANMVVVSAADAASTRVITRAIADYKGPVYLRIGRNPFEQVFDENYQFEIGKANVMLDEGKDACIICHGIVAARCLAAAKALKEKGIGVRLIEMPTIKPIDKEAIVSAAAECKNIVTVEDHNIIGGLGGAVAEVLAEAGMGKLKRMGIPDCYGQSGTDAELLEYFGLTVENIVHTVEEFIK